MTAVPEDHWREARNLSMLTTPGTKSARLSIRPAGDSDLGALAAALAKKHPPMMLTTDLSLRVDAIARRCRSASLLWQDSIPDVDYELTEEDEIADLKAELLASR